MERSSPPILDKIVRLSNEIYNELGSGHSESVYHKALEFELSRNNIEFNSEVVIPIYYKDHYVGFGRCDIFIEKTIIVELKAVSSLRNINQSKTRCYMKSLGVEFGVMINFPTFPLICSNYSCEIQKLVQYPNEK